MIQNPKLQLIMEIDTSEVGIRAVLSQRSPKDNCLHPCAFDVGNWELLAVKVALEEWRHWLEGTEQPFFVWTNHRNLEYLQTTKRLNVRQARWALFLNCFNFHLSFRPGTKNLKADALSRIHCVDSGPSEPEYVLPRTCILGAIRWEVEERVLQAQGPGPTPEGCAPHRSTGVMPLHCLIILESRGPSPVFVSENSHIFEPVQV